jgi:hypothetical protein
MLRSLAASSVVVASLMITTAARADKPVGMSDLWLGLGVVAQSDPYVGTSSVSPAGSWYGMRTRITTSMVDSFRNDDSPFRVGDLIGLDLTVGFGSTKCPSSDPGCSTNSADVITLASHILAGVQFAYRINDVLDVGLKVYLDAGFGRISYFGPVVRPFVRVGPVYADLGYGAQNDRKWIEASLRYLFARNSNGSQLFIGGEYVQPSDINHNVTDGTRTRVDELTLMMGIFF